MELYSPAQDHEIIDTVLEDTYSLEFNANDWRDKVYPPVYGDVEDLIAREVREVKLLVARICSYPATPFTTISRLNCNNLELWCISIISLVKKFVEFMPKPSWEEFEQNQHRFIARLVGVAEILVRSSEGTR
ncbi:GL19247 [Drosophila persimilis]|uniref:GL19247 n=1 Tax=Drosophila persimilis TaxID=7234 RepID=B4G873_DROPE|nr:GL19247 [Drosophila persimilis]